MLACRAARALAGLALGLAAGCGRAESPPSVPDQVPMILPVDVVADTGRSVRLHIALPEPAAPDSVPGPPRARVWLAQVAPSRPGLLAAPLPDPDFSISDEAWPSPPGLEVNPDLRPPLLIAAGTLRVPRGARRASVDLDVRVAETGSVSEALWAGGSSDTALVRSAVECALAMRFHPALQGGRPVAVWCRQRFDFGRR